MDPILSVLLLNIATLLGAALTLATIWWHGRTERYALSWALAFLAAMPGIPLGLGLSPPYSPAGAASALLGGLLVDLAALLLADGMVRFGGGRLRWRRWLMGGAFVFGMSCLAMVRGDYVLHKLLNAGFVQVMTVLGAVALLRPAGKIPRRGGIGHGLMLAGLALLFVVSLLYGMDMLLYGGRLQDAGVGLALPLVLMVQPFIVMALGMGGVIVMCQRLIAEREAQGAAAEEAAQRARSADRAKSEFLAAISHELRTPINAIQGCLQILGAHGLNPSQARLAEVMGSSSAALLALIEDVLDVARMEAGNMELSPGVTDLGGLLRDLAAAQTLKAEQKGLAFALRTGSGLPPAVMADGRRLAQILTNLLGNAIKFTDQGRVTLSVECVKAPKGAPPPLETGEAPAWVRFEVTDTGIGVPADKLDSIFQSFSQADNTLTRRFGGAGLGLSIARRLAEMMGGSIRVESQPGQGSRFSVTLPLSPVRPGSAAERGPRGITSLLPQGPEGRPVVMLVETDEVNRFVTTDLLVGRGADVVQAADAAEALEILARHRIDLVLMDLSMPDMDGIEAARRIRALGHPAGAVPVVAMTGPLSAELRQQCRDAGIQAFLTRPIRLESLVGTLTGLLPAMDKPAA